MPKPDPDLPERLSADYDDVVAYLRANSGLPGPRANLELLAAAGALLSPDHAERLRAEPEEYLRCCGVVALAGAFAADPGAVVLLLTRAAADDSWRVREAVAMAAQRIGDDDLPALLTLVHAWCDHPDPLVQRAAVASICEPRLLRRPAGAAAALSACARVTANLLQLPRHRRSRPDARTLRQALGYCWSVAVAADPVRGLPPFLALDPSDPDLGWIVRTNLSKARLKRLLPA